MIVFRLFCSPRAQRAQALVLVALAATALASCNKTSAEGAAAGGGGRGGGGRGGRGGGAQPVVVAKVTKKDVPVEIPAVGSVEAYTTITIRSQITGQLQEMTIHEGDAVKKGQVLFTIDRRPFEAALQQAQANLTRDEALLAQSEAQLAKDQATAQYQQLSFERQSELVERGIISKDTGQQAKAQADALAASVKADQASVESAKAQLAAQQAAVDTAKVQLGYCIITAPIDGRGGDITVKPGNLVTANTTTIMTIAQVEPVFVTFSVPAVHLPNIKAHMSDGKLPVTAIPQDSEAEPVDGKLTFLDNTVDPTTDTIKLKATFTNADRRLWPGQFARVNLRLTTLQNATVVSQQAVQTGQDGQFVFVVKQDQTVEQRPVVVAQRVGDDIVIQKGLDMGETVVTEGQLRLEQGTRIQVTDPNGTPAGGGRGGRGGRGGNNRGGQQGQGQGQAEGQRGQAEGQRGQ
jgi:multidrug efflux system membrane fusion protein